MTQEPHCRVSTRPTGLRLETRRLQEKPLHIISGRVTASEGRAPMLMPSLDYWVLDQGLFWDVRRGGGWEEAFSC